MKKTATVILLITAVILVGAAIVLFSIGPQTVMGRVMGVVAPPPDGLDTATTRRSDQGLFQVTYASAKSSISINQIHPWTVHLETVDGQIIEQAEITVTGGMPQHGHGLPTQPQISGEAPASGRQGGVQKVLADEFNCLGPYSEAAPDDCTERRFLMDNGEDLAGAFKPPTLRNVAESAPYMHAGQYADLFMVVRYYRHPPQAAIGQSELEPLPFMHTGMMHLEAFLHSLSGPLATSPDLIAPADK